METTDSQLSSIKSIDTIPLEQCFSILATFISTSSTLEVSPDRAILIGSKYDKMLSPFGCLHHTELFRTSINWLTVAENTTDSPWPIWNNATVRCRAGGLDNWNFTLRNWLLLSLGMQMISSNNVNLTTASICFISLKILLRWYLRLLRIELKAAILVVNMTRISIISYLSFYSTYIFRVEVVFISYVCVNQKTVDSTHWLIGANLKRFNSREEEVQVERQRERTSLKGSLLSDGVLLENKIILDSKVWTKNPVLKPPTWPALSPSSYNSKVRLLWADRRHLFLILSHNEYQFRRHCLTVHKMRTAWRFRDWEGCAPSRCWPFSVCPDREHPAHSAWRWLVLRPTKRGRDLIMVYFLFVKILGVTNDALCH